MQLSLKHCKLWFSDETGGLYRIQPEGAPAILDIAPEKAGLLDLAFPQEKFGPLRLYTPGSNAQLETDGETYVIVRYDALAPSRQDLGVTDRVSAAVTIRALPDGKSFSMEAEITNHSDQLVPQILFPDFRGLVPVSGEDHTWFRQGAVKMLPFKELGVNYMYGVRQYWRGCWWEHFPPGKGWWGGTAMGRWSHFGSLRAGLGVFDAGWYPDPEHSVYLRVPEEAPSRARMCFTREYKGWDQLNGDLHLQEDEGIRPWQTWRSAPFIVTAHAGGWPHGIKRYREHVHARVKKVKIADHVRDEIGLRTLFMAEIQEYSPEHAEFLWKDLPRMGKECKALGISELNIWGGLGPYFTVPFGLNPVLGTTEDFTAANQALKEMGVNASYFISCTTLTPESSRRFGGKGTTEEGWSYHAETIPAINPGYYQAMCGSLIDTCNEAWQDAVLDSARRLRDLGALSFSWDQYQISPGKRDLSYVSQKLIEMTAAHNPMWTYSAESTTSPEIEHDVLQYTWNWRGDVLALFKTAHRSVNYAAPALSVWPNPRLNLNVEKDPVMIIQGFTDNFYLNFLTSRPDHIWGSGWFSEEPALSALIGKLSALRKAYLPFFNEGLLLGDGAMDEDHTDLHTSAYVLGDEVLFFLFNNSRAEARDVTVGMDLNAWIPCVTAHTAEFFDLDNRPLGSVWTEGSKFRAHFPTLDKDQLMVIRIRTA